MENYDCMLTTNDNPYCPFDQFNLWLMFDKEKGYNTCEKIARIAELAEDMTQKEEDEAIEKAIDRIIELDILDIYKKVRRQATINP